MTETKHSPGEWKRNERRNAVHHFSAVSAAGRLVADVYGDTIEQAIANADRIVVAVNSHDALVDACQKGYAMKQPSDDVEPPGLGKFFETARPVADLKVALAVIQEFKGLESDREWFLTPFACWARLEQLEDYLKLLTDTDVDSVKDEIAIELLRSHRERTP